VIEEISDHRLFVEMVKAGNLSAASRALDSSPAAMSRRLRALESRLGVRLVTRNSRTFKLTEEGHFFYDRCLRITSSIAEAEAEVSSKGGRVSGALHIGAPMAIGRRLVAPLIGRFTQEYPDVHVHLTLSDSGLDVIEDALDIALRVELPSETSLITRRILTTQRVVCASPAYLKRHGPPSRPEDLQRHNCIRLVRGRRVIDRWVFQEKGKRFEVCVNGTLTTTSGEVVHDWVRKGLGIALKASWDISADLSRGILVQCLRDFWCDEIKLFAICADRHLPPRTQVFLAYVAKNLPNEVQNSSRKSAPR
jgi:DNA-binding transcriptional LysR family regulator